MIESLLIIIAVLLVVRIVLQLRPDKRAFEKMYQATSEVENIAIRIEDRDNNLENALKEKNSEGYELIQAVPAQIGVVLFFTRKKIKNFLEE